MTDTEQSTVNETPPERAMDSPGKMLREGREKMNLSSQDVAERLRLRQQIVEDLEHDKFCKYVAGTFTRGYLRAYARLVQVDETSLFKAYEALGVEEPKPDSMQSFSRRRREQTQDSRLMALTYVIGAVIIGSAVIFWLQNSATEEVAHNEPTFAERLIEEQSTQVEMSEQPLASEPEIAETTAQQPIFIDQTLLEQQGPEQVPEQPVATHAAEQPATAINEPAQEETTAVVETRRQRAEQRAEALQQGAEQSPAETVPAPALPEGELVLAFAGDCWIRIEDANGDAIAFGVKPEGHVISLEGDAPFEVTLGAPEVVTLVFRGEEIDLSAYRPGRVARITLPQSE